jgi:DNA-directed RNA polymerase I, II, and III subunit RPABC2
MSDIDSDSDNEISGSDSESSININTPITKPKQNNFNNIVDDLNDELSDDELPDDDEDIDLEEDDDDNDNNIILKKANVAYGKEQDELSNYDDDNAESESDEDEDEDEDEPNRKKSSSKKTVNLGNQNVNNSFDMNIDEDEDEDEDENYLQKFNSDINKTYINEFHPECIIHNFDEVAALSHVVKDKNGIIIDDLHKTIPFLTKYERARILGQRAKQIECGSRPFVKVPENIVDSYIIADLELKEKKIPFIIRRPIPGGGCEYWNLKDLEIVHF